MTPNERNLIKEIVRLRKLACAYRILGHSIIARDTKARWSEECIRHSTTARNWARVTIKKYEHILQKDTNPWEA